VSRKPTFCAPVAASPVSGERSGAARTGKNAGGSAAPALNAAAIAGPTLLLGISAEELTPEAESLLKQAPRNFLPAPWIKQEDRTQPPRPKEDFDFGPEAKDRREIPELLGAK
jgi:hypothetical protein